MPWSEKARELLRGQYAAVGAAGRSALNSTSLRLSKAADRLSGEAIEQISALQTNIANRQTAIEKFTTAYRQYCWPVESIDDFKLAPFHLLATENKVHIDQQHSWHMTTLAKICDVDPAVLLATQWKLVDLTDVDSIADATQWWLKSTDDGGEGMVVKPLDWMVRGKKGWVQPAVKCRGKEYLRIIYSPDYDSAENLPRVKRQLEIPVCDN